MNITEYRIHKFKVDGSMNIHLTKNHYTVWSVVIWSTLNRSRSVAYNTHLVDMYNIKNFFIYCNDLSVDLEGYIMKGDYGKTINLFQDFCFYIRLKKSLKTKSLLKPDHVNRIISSVNKYLKWLIIYFCNDRDNQSRYTKQINEIYNVSKFKVRGNFNSTPKSLNIKSLNLAFDYIKNNNSSKYPKLRNFIILSLLLDTGARTSEILKLKTIDILSNQNNKKYIFIRDNRQDISDTRNYEFGLKTSGRQIYVENKLAELIDYYIDFHRRPRGKKLRHLYLFTNSRTGDPLSRSSVNKLFQNTVIP